jgi:fibronectin-binding autotransporter adhesin
VVPEGGAIGEAAPGQGGPGESVPAGAEAQGGGGGGEGGGGGPVETGGGAGSLPFTGFAAAGVAGIGAVLGGVGAALRRVVKRRSYRR